METRVTRLEALVEQQAQTNARIEGKFDRLEGKLDRLAEQVTAVSLKVSKLPTNADLWQNTVTIGSVAGVVVTIVLAALAVAN
jgi:phage shock protein A